jgi:hypothetical protein
MHLNLTETIEKLLPLSDGKGVHGADTGQSMVTIHELLVRVSRLLVASVLAAPGMKMDSTTTCTKRQQPFGREGVRNCEVEKVYTALPKQTRLM